MNDKNTPYYEEVISYGVICSICAMYDSVTNNVLFRSAIHIKKVR